MPSAAKSALGFLPQGQPGQLAIRDASRSEPFAHCLAHAAAAIDAQHRLGLDLQGQYGVFVAQQYHRLAGQRGSCGGVISRNGQAGSFDAFERIAEQAELGLCHQDSADRLIQLRTIRTHIRMPAGKVAADESFARRLRGLIVRPSDTGRSKIAIAQQNQGMAEASEISAIFATGELTHDRIAQIPCQKSELAGGPIA